MRKKKYLILVLLAGVMFGPSPSFGETLDLMTFDECEAANYCKVEGLLGLQEFGSIKMGQLDFPDGRCISVSLPEEAIEDLELNGPRQSIIEGGNFNYKPGPFLIALRVDGRFIEYPECGDWYVFVDNEVKEQKEIGPVLTISEVLENEDNLNGKQIVVEGYVMINEGSITFIPSLTKSVYSFSLKPGKITFEDLGFNRQKVVLKGTLNSESCRKPIFEPFYRCGTYLSDYVILEIE